MSRCFCKYLQEGRYSELGANDWRTILDAVQTTTAQRPSQTLEPVQDPQNKRKRNINDQTAQASVRKCSKLPRKHPHEESTSLTVLHSRATQDGESDDATTSNLVVLHPATLSPNRNHTSADNRIIDLLSSSAQHLDQLEQVKDVWMNNTDMFLTAQFLPNSIPPSDLLDNLTRAMYIYKQAGGLGWQAQLIQNVTSFAFASKWSTKHRALKMDGEKQFRERGNKWIKIVERFDYGSIMVLPFSTQRLNNQELLQKLDASKNDDNLARVWKGVEEYRELGLKLVNAVDEFIFKPEQVEEHQLTQTTNLLLRLIYTFQGAAIEESVLFRGIKPQPRWDTTGNRREVRLVDSHPHFTKLFSSDHELRRVIEKCLHEKLITRTYSQGGGNIYTLADEEKCKLIHSLPLAQLIVSGILFITFVFPREEPLDDGSTGRTLLPYLTDVWKHLCEDATSIPANELREGLVEAFLAASRISSPFRRASMSWIRSMLDHVSNPLRIAIVDRHSAMLRAEGKHTQADEEINETINQIPCSNTLTHCLYGRMLLSRAENAMLRKDFSTAESYLNDWSTKEKEPSQLELHILRMKNTAFARLWRYKGEFIEAEKYLRVCLQGTSTENSHYHVLYHLGDVLCELDRAQEVEDLLATHIQKLREVGKATSKECRRLLLPLAEAMTMLEKTQEAESKLNLLDAAFGAIKKPDISDQLCHVRTIIGLIRNACHRSDWSKALELSDKAAQLAEGYDAFRRDNFYIGVIFRFKAYILYQLRQFQQSKQAMDTAGSYDSVRRHFAAGLGTYVLDALEKDLTEVWKRHVAVTSSYT